MLAVAVLGIAGLLSMLVAWQGDGMEVARHTIEGNVEIRIAVLVLVVIAVLGHAPSTTQSSQAQLRSRTVDTERTTPVAITTASHCGISKVHQARHLRHADLP